MANTKRLSEAEKHAIQVNEQIAALDLTEDDRVAMRLLSSDQAFIIMGKVFAATLALSIDAKVTVPQHVMNVYRGIQELVPTDTQFHEFRNSDRLYLAKLLVRFPKGTPEGDHLRKDFNSMFAGML